MIPILTCFQTPAHITKPQTNTHFYKYDMIHNQISHRNLKSNKERARVLPHLRNGFYIEERVVGGGPGIKGDAS